ncbi:MAG: zinc ribbon domain-containing protein [Methanospirillum sp.]
MQCPKCATGIPDDSFFCPECGNRIDGPKTTLTPGHLAQMREYARLPAELPEIGSATGRTVPAEPAAPSSSSASSQDRSFQKALYEMNGRMGDVLRATSELDFSDDAAVRRAYQALMDESAASSKVLSAFTVSTALAPLQRSSLASLENYGLAATYYLQHLDEVRAHGRTDLADSLWDQSNEFFMKGIEFSGQASIHDETGEEYQGTAYMDACLEWVESQGTGAVYRLKTASPGDAAAIGRVGEELLAPLQEFEQRIRPLLLSPVMDRQRTLMLQAIGDYRLAADWARKYAGTGGSGELGATYHDLVLQYLRLGEEHETAAHDYVRIT